MCNEALESKNLVVLYVGLWGSNDFVDRGIICLCPSLRHVFNILLITAFFIENSKDLSAVDV